MALGALAELILVLAGCQRQPASRCTPAGGHLVVATTDFQEVGTLATVEGPECMGDRWSSTSADAIVRTVGDRVLSIDRTGGDAIRAFAPGRYDIPTDEFVVERQGNVHDALAVGDQWWFALYDKPFLARTDAHGELLAPIDLSPYADSDGLPEADRMVSLGDTVYLALQKLDRDNGWAPAGGSVLAISSDGTVLEEVEIGPNPKLASDPQDPDALLALTGKWQTPDGGLVRYDTRDGSVTELLTEEELGYDLGGMAGIGAHLVLLGVHSDGSSQLLCMDTDTQALTEGRSTPAWLVEALTGGDQVYVAVRSNWEGGVTRQVWQVDPITCEDTLLADSFSLDPYAMAWVPRGRTVVAGE